MAGTPTAGPSAGVEPWHMWGSTINLIPTVETPLTPAYPAIQVARVNYRRPETWCFFLHARVRGIVPAAPLSIFVRYNILTGVGRSMVDTSQTRSNADSFCVMRFEVGVGVAPDSLPAKWTTTVPSTPLDDTLVPLVTYPVDRFVGQNIQLSVGATMTGPGAGPGYMVEASAYLSPLHHARPDWFQDLSEKQKFAGKETGGA